MAFVEGIGLGQYVRDWKEWNYNDFAKMAGNVWLSSDLIKFRIRSHIHELENRV